MEYLPAAEVSIVVFTRRNQPKGRLRRSVTIVGMKE
jgi:hypothetical protein